ncbi:unnamed protein product [Rotaria magnacalcarata]|uniref:Uncharacterized protein n=1 Tax=Rotaria magnacalcarata TaxID=392030 RepID=A0A815ZFD5_9BILA|nr:unnamed protein product [Rotaria magnacalcarata]CAF1932006.1 unnamed protein product [Rotaria magnacalcarata]CAF2069720.1 unnamed protein product [Rotaria magnacalcarata]CAF3902797.1 unnamed protein product [Rotaria magnacalcarata]CAF4086195.1 unnamed protein product [Rotaria magnacalcarata]
MKQHNETKEEKDTESTTEKPKLSLMSGIALLVGSIIGSGIFISPRGVLLGTGSYGLSILVWIVCGLICVPGCLCYAELGTMIHSSGGDYTYIKMAFGDWAGFLRVWSEICCVRPAIIAVCGITASIYLLQPIYSPCSPPHLAVLLLACFFILMLTLLNLCSTRGSVIWQNGTFYAKIFSLLLLISLGAFQLVRGHYDVFTSPFENTQTSVKKLSIALYIGLFPYSGWNYLSNAIEELKQPERNFPIAIMTSIIASTVLYALAYSAYFTALTPFNIMTADAVAVSFAENVYRPLGFIMPLFVSISALGGLNGQIFSIVRMFSVAGRDGLLPTISAYIHYENLTPVIPCIVEGILGVLYVLVGDADRLLGYLSFSTWLVCLCGAISVLVFRRTMPDVARPFNAGIAAPVIFIIAMTALTFVNVIFNPVDILVGVLILLSGLPIYWIFVLRRPKLVDKFSRSVVLYLQKALLIVPDNDKQHD